MKTKGRTYEIPTLPLPYELETMAVLKQLNRANRKLAELKGVARSIPNEQILIGTLTLQEAKDSSSVENIVTTQDDLFRADLATHEPVKNASVKEVLSYRKAIHQGFAMVRKDRLLTLNIIKKIQAEMRHSDTGFRHVPGTQLKNDIGETVYTPPQDPQEIERLMANLEQFINDATLCDLDPLVKMAIIHHQFESIHPFYDGNGRTGRIVNVLYLVTSGLLDLPILYLSRYITHHKGEYYRLIQAIRDKNHDNAAEWEAWILYILRGVEQTAEDTIHLVLAIGELMNRYKQVLRPLFGKQYKHDLLNHLFFHPYTKVEFMQEALQVSRNTAVKYLNMIMESDLLFKIRVGRQNYYINKELVELFVRVSDPTRAADRMTPEEISTLLQLV